MEDINLDFLLKTPPKQDQHVQRASSPFVYNEFDVRFGKKKNGSKKFNMAQRIAKVDELVQEIIKLKQNNELNQQLKDYKTTAQKVQELYTKEKENYSKVKSNLENLQEQYNKIDLDFTNTTMVNDQLKARLEEQDGRPISYNNLVIKYVRIVSKLENDDLLKNFPDKDLVERLREYCAAFRLKLPQMKSPKRSRLKGNRTKFEDMFVQCDLSDEISLQKGECSSCKNKPKMQDQSIQHASVKHEQGTQYISTMITRQTNTDKIVKKHVQTMFPEPPAIDEIINVYSRWSDIRSVSPLLESPLRVCSTPSEELLKKFSTTGTCTMLCNIRRKIDYLPLNNSSNIKEEFYTPSASPTLNSFCSTTNRTKESSHTSNPPENINSSLKFNLFNSSINSSLGQLSSNAFHELWQIFGKMLLSLLQNSNAGIANTIQTSPLNQQQFIDWLLDLFMNFQSQNTSTVQTQTKEKNVPSDSNVSTSPLVFNDASSLLTNVVRPEPQKTLAPKTDAREEGTKVRLNSNLIDENNSTSTTYSSNFPLQSFLQDSNSVDNEMQQIQINSNTNEFHATNADDCKRQEKQRINTSKEHSKYSKKSKIKDKIIDQIQELLPEIKLNERKRKALKRLLKNNNHRKKSFETRKNENLNVIGGHASPVVIIANESLCDDTTETAVDFLKTFATQQESNQPLEETISETEKIFIKQISSENIPKSDEFTFTKPLSNFSHSRTLNNSNSDTFVKQPIKPKNFRETKQLKNKYQLLFCDLDSECKEHEIEMENSKLSLKSVIQIPPNTNSDSSNHYVNECTESTNESVCVFDLNQFQQQFPFANKPLPSFDNFSNRNSSQEILSISNEPLPIIENLQNSIGLHQVVNDQSSKYFYFENNPQSFETSNENSKYYVNECTENVNENLCALDFNQLQHQFPLTNRPTPVFDNSSNRTSSQETLLMPHDPIPIQNSFHLNHVDTYIQSSDSSTKNINNCSFVYIDNNLENDLNLSSDNNSVEEDYEYALNNISSTEAKLNKETTTTEELKFQHNNRKSNSHGFDRIDNKKTDEFYTMSMSTLSESSVKMHEKIITTSLPIQNDDDFSPNNSLKNSNHPVAPPLYSKDFELSSDNESIISENELNAKKYCSPTITANENPKLNFISNPACIPQKNHHKKEKASPISIKNTQPKHQKYNQLNKWEKSFANFISNLSSQPKSNFPKTLQSDNALKKKGSLQITHNNLQSKQLKNYTNSSIDSKNYNTSNGFKKQLEKEENKVLNKFGINTLAPNSKSKDESIKQTEVRTKTNQNNNTEQGTGNLKINPKEENTLFMQNENVDNKEEKSLCENEKLRHFLDQNNLEAKYEITLENASHPLKDHSLSEESSLSWSVITVSDSTLSDELLKTPYRKSDNKIVSPESRHLNCNSMANAISSKEEVLLPNNLEVQKNFKTEHNTNLTNEKGSNTNPSTAMKLKGVVTKENETIWQHETRLNGRDDSCTQAIKNTLRNLTLSNIETKASNELYFHKSDDKVDHNDSSDSLSIENELTIDEEPNETSLKESETEEYNNDSLILTESDKSNHDSTSSNNISTLLNSTLYSEVLSESFKQIADEMLEIDMVTVSPTQKIKPKIGRKRKGDSLAEQLPCKRSQRLKAKQMILEESFNLSKTPIELGKYTKVSKNILNKEDVKSIITEDIKKENLQIKCDTVQNCKLLENENSLKMGFFRERDVDEQEEEEKEVTVKNNKQFTVIKEQKPELSNGKLMSTSNEAENPQQHQHQQQQERQSQPSNCHDSKEEKQIPPAIKYRQEEEEEEEEEEEKKTYSQIDCIRLEPGFGPEEECIYSDSPQSPAAATVETNNENILEIPIDRLPQFMPQENNQTLFDVLINSYKNENQKLVLDSVTTKEFKRQEDILNQFGQQLNLFCYNEMELDPYCTSTQVINKLLSISTDYSLLQTAVINIAKKAEGTNVPENYLPSIIQEMPPRHLSKCLHRLFAFLRNMVTRNSDFCHDLASEIEIVLFKSKQAEKLSVQATLNLTQLYLMTCKIQEYLHIPKHPARLFIAKCLFFHLQNSVLMIHEVLMWYPTVLPHREDTTYDRSDALISVIQQILMNTRYEMHKSDCRDRALLSKLRYEYHFEPFKPSLDEVVAVLVEKLKNSKFYNICMAFGLLSKRIGVLMTQNILLNQHLLPLAKEYYSLALQTNEYDKRIEVLLEIISMLVKTLPFETDVRKYFNEFSRFLNDFDRQLIQEAALRSILRLQRYNVEYCFNLLRHLQPTYTLNTHTQAMLKTFLYRRPVTFWKKLQKQNFNKFR